MLGCLQLYSARLHLVAKCTVVLSEYSAHTGSGSYRQPIAHLSAFTVNSATNTANKTQSSQQVDLYFMKNDNDENSTKLT